MKMRNKLLFAVCSLLICVGMFGCGKVKEIHIQDGYTETIYEVDETLTVQEAIEEAEILLNEKDKVIPELSTSISEINSDIMIERYAEVILKVDGEQKTFSLNGAKVKDVIEQNSITLDENDLINYDLERYLENGMEIEVIHRQMVKLVDNGTKSEIITAAKTVKELLESESIKLDKDDRISPKLSTKIKEGMTIKLKRVKVEKKVVTEKIPYTTRTVISNSMYKGTSKITQAGANGEKKVTYEITMVDGKEESRKVVKEEVIKQPVDRVITVGNKEKQTGKRVVSKQKVYDCDGSGHGYYIITYSDGTVEYKEF